MHDADVNQAIGSGQLILLEGLKSVESITSLDVCSHSVLRIYLKPKKKSENPIGSGQ